MPWQWPRGDPKMLAGFVNKQAGLYLPPLPFSTEDLRHFDPHNRVRRIAEAIYQVLADQNIYYGPSRSTCLGRKRPRSFASRRRC